MQDNEPYIISKRKSVRKIYFGRIIAVIIVLCLIGIGVVLWFSRVGGKITVAEHEYWAVSVYSSQSAAEAEQNAQSVIQSGGAGYKYGSNPYKVMACCYENKQQAQTVGNRLSEQGESNVEYVKFLCPEISVDKPKTNYKLLSQMLTAPYELFGELYDVFVKTDKKEIQEAAALYAALKMSETCNGYLTECVNLDTKVGGYLSELYTELSAAFTELSATQTGVPQKIKYTLCKIADVISEKSTQFVNK